jgi:hypothetical protein
MYLYVKAVREAPQSSRKIIYQLRWNHSHAICFLHHRKQILSSVSRAGVGFNFQVISWTLMVHIIVGVVFFFNLFCNWFSILLELKKAMLLFAWVDLQL